MTLLLRYREYFFISLATIAKGLCSMTKNKVQYLLTLLMLLVVSCSSTPEKSSTQSQIQPQETPKSTKSMATQSAPVMELYSYDASKWSRDAIQNFNNGVRYLKSNSKKASEFFYKAIALAPSMEPAYFNVLKIAINGKHLTEIDKIYALYLKQKMASPRLMTLMGLAKRMKGEFKVSKKLYSDAIKLNNSYLTAILNMAILEDVYLGDVESAQKYYLMYQKQLQIQGKKDKNLKNWLADIKQRMKHRQNDTTTSEGSKGNSK